jgi:hypothetical protein
MELSRLERTVIVVEKHLAGTIPAAIHLRAGSEMTLYAMTLTNLAAQTASLLQLAQFVGRVLAFVM